MTRVADEVIGRFARRQHDWMERVIKGSLDPEAVYRAVKPLIDSGEFRPRTLVRNEYGHVVMRIDYGAGRRYHVALVPAQEIEGPRTTRNIRAYGQSLGYRKPFIGVMPGIRRALSSATLEQLGFDYIAGLHNAVPDPAGQRLFLLVINGRDAGEPWLIFGGEDARGWPDNGAFAFLIPETSEAE